MKSKKILAGVLVLSLMAALVGCGSTDESSEPVKPMAETSQEVTPFSRPDTVPDSFPDADITLVTDEKLTEETAKAIGDKYFELVCSNNFKAQYDYTDTCFFGEFNADLYSKTELVSDDITFVRAYEGDSKDIDYYNKVIEKAGYDTSHVVSGIWKADYTVKGEEWELLILKFEDGWRIDTVLNEYVVLTDEELESCKQDGETDIDLIDESENDFEITTSEEGENDNE